MEIIPLGVGSAFAKTLQNTNFLIRPDKGEPFLLDCGHTATRRLVELGVSPADISHIIISHLHADHVGGLEEMGFSGLFIWKNLVNLHLPEALVQWLWPHCLEAGMGQRLKTEDGGFYEADASDYFKMQVMESVAPTSFGSVEVTAFPTPHVPGRPSYGFLMRETTTGESVMFTCDSMFSLDNIEKYGTDAALIFHDCEFSSREGSIHTSLDDLKTLDDRIQSRILLTHYGDNWGNHVDSLGALGLAKEGDSYRV